MVHKTGALQCRPYARRINHDQSVAHLDEFSEEGAMQLENYKIFAEAYSTFNVEPLIEALADDCIFESQMVLQPLEGKPDIEEYLRGKFATFRKSKTYITCSLARVGSCPVLTAVGKPSL